MPDKYFGEVKWSDRDLEEALEERGIRATKEIVSNLRSMIEIDHHFTDSIVAAGWEAINNKIAEWLESSWRDDNADIAS